jgi:hypothetical protein
MKKRSTIWMEVVIGPMWLVVAGAWAVSAALASMQSIL